MSANAAPIDQVVDWELAARTAAAVAGAGPALPQAQARETVAGLRAAAAAAVPHVRAITGLAAPGPPSVLVVDRAGWSRVNTRSFRALLEPVFAESFARRERLPSPAAVTVGSRVTGAEVGALLGFLSGRVLGQYDAFGTGDLLLVAPTIVAVQRDLDVDGADFRQWVCLHEETHRVQFAAAPWLAEHLLTEIRTLVGDLIVEPVQLADRLGSLLRGLPDVLRGDPATTVLDVVQSPEQRRRLARLTAVMSLLEGHADVVMDGVDPGAVPTVTQIRERFSRRRTGRGALDRLLRRLLGLDAKARQYADGARFVRGVVERVGMSGFNAVWAGSETLPGPEEIADPVAWVRRVHP